MTTRRKRILAVTAGLFVFGAVAGALAGAAVGALAALLPDDRGTRFGPAWMDVGALFGASVGAPMGAVLLPLAGWLLMRHVPIGQALVGTMLGTIVGGLVGWYAPVGSDEIARSLVGAILGFALVVILLRRRAPARSPAPPVE